MHLKRMPLALAALPVAGYILLLTLVAALYVKPPLVGWIGLAVVVAVSIALGAGAVLLFPRMRTNISAVAPRAADGVLVLVDAHCPTEALCAGVAGRVHDRDVEVHVVAPVLASPLHYMSDDEDAERDAAHQRLDDTLEELRRAGVRATGALGDDDPLQALGDALSVFPARELVIVTARDSHWLERDLLTRAREIVPRVEHIVVGRERVPS